MKTEFDQVNDDDDDDDDDEDEDVKSKTKRFGAYACQIPTHIVIHPPQLKPKGRNVVKKRNRTGGLRRKWRTFSERWILMEPLRRKTVKSHAKGRQEKIVA